MAAIKPRWQDWENKCLKKAVEQKIQLKIMAFALGKTVDSVSKKIKKLGLRGENSKRGRLKGDKSDLSWVDKIPRDRAKMVDILQVYAPLQVSQKEQMALKEGYWVSSPLSSQGLKRGKSLGGISQEKASFSLSLSLDYILSKDHIPQKIKREKTFGDPFYVPLQHVEKWAVSEGFYQVGSPLQQRGLFYWKEGRYFSKAQLLIYVNRIRLERKLQPLAFYEEEENVCANFSTC
jgi:hypothetical protein